MMNTTEKLIRKLDRFLNIESDSLSISPTSLGSNNRKSLLESFHITKDMSIEKLTTNKLIMIHALLHQFYVTGNRELSKQDIEQLHAKIIERNPHKEFDKLDRQ